ncbi:MAG: RadC family protein [Filifactoraceae bacterium]
MGKIKLLNTNERPREKLTLNGIGFLSNSELLAILLNNGSKNKSAIELGDEIILKVDGIRNLMDITLTELMEINGIGIAKASRILTALELAKRISKTNRMDNLKFDSPLSIFNAYSDELRYLKKEIFKIILLDTKNRLLTDILISEGSLSSSIVHPREVMIPAIKNSASKLILLHNHPSGDPYPSQEDINITKILIECGKLLDIPVLDHIIIGEGCYYSFKEKNNIFK